MAKRSSITIKNDMANHLASIFAGGTMKLYTGSQPTLGYDPPTGTLLATVTLPSPCFNAAVNGQLTKTGTWSGPVIAPGTPGWFRMADVSGAKSIDGAIGAGLEVEVDFEPLVIGQIVIVDIFNMVEWDSIF